MHQLHARPAAVPIARNRQLRGAFRRAGIKRLHARERVVRNFRAARRKAFHCLPADRQTYARARPHLLRRQTQNAAVVAARQSAVARDHDQKRFAFLLIL